MAKKPRPQHKKMTKADRMRGLFKDLSQEELADTSVLMGIVKKARLQTNSSDVYRIRNEYVTSTLPSTDGSELDLSKSLLLVKRTAEQVGGLSQLKELTSIIERIRQ